MLSATFLDSLFYHYTAGSNRLDYVDDIVGAGTPGTDIDDESPLNYRYDAGGRLVSDAAEGITKVTWSPYNKVLTVLKSNGSRVHFQYDAAGNRIKKAVVDTTGAGL
ncbi:MAG TPA: hypothetical protein VHI13_22480, partial [Candidatus Kapabacteria bacterium]|nr:hypothetical protein [Candidatus Kapabacteria bacterium]